MACGSKDRPGPEGERHIIGLGLDNHDGEVRLTKGENFHLFGGSAETHGQMQEKCIKLNEKLRQRGKRLEQLEPQELSDLAAECDMNLRSPGSKR